LKVVGPWRSKRLPRDLSEAGIMDIDDVELGQPRTSVNPNTYLRKMFSVMTGQC